MCILRGHGPDGRTGHDGQIKTRLEAFLEMLDSGENREAEKEETAQREQKIC